MGDGYIARKPKGSALKGKKNAPKGKGTALQESKQEGQIQP